jgi:hypothetical protein
MIEYDPLALLIAQRAIAIQKAITEVQKAYAEWDIKDALNTRNGPLLTAIHTLPLNSNMLI